MNGPQHYAMAETLLRGAGDKNIDDGDFLVALAQVHATLALAAVQVAVASPDAYVRDVVKVWRGAVS